MESIGTNDTPRNHVNNFFKIIIFLLILLSVGNARAHEIMFIQSEPCAEMRAHQPYPCNILRFNPANKELYQVWSLKLDSSAWFRVQYVHVFSNNSPIIISEGPHSEPTILHVISPKELDKSGTLDISQFGYISQYYYFQEFSGKGKIIVQYVPDTAKREFQYAWLDIETGLEAKKPDSSSVSGEIRLSGPYPEYSGGYELDAIGFRALKDVPLRPENVDIPIDVKPVPDSLARMRNSFGWGLIANDAEFSALMSSPEKNDLTERELLIYNKKTGIWNSMMIEGEETLVRPINGWLTGIIADPDPETDYNIRKGFPPILREDVVVINPLENHQFKVHLGKQGEVLWIEDSTAFYRVDDGLYKAKIQNDDFVERTLLIKDPRVRQIHWAFRGSMGNK